MGWLRLARTVHGNGETTADRYGQFKDNQYYLLDTLDYHLRWGNYSAKKPFKVAFTSRTAGSAAWQGPRSLYDLTRNPRRHRSGLPAIRGARRPERLATPKSHCRGPFF